jgi:group I intron endonuclease
MARGIIGVKMKYKIYKIINIVNNKIYIGQTTKTLKERFDKHTSTRNISDLPLYTDMVKFGIENFKIELIETTDDPSKMEAYYIKHFESYKRDIGYNVSKGMGNKNYFDEEIIELYKKTKNANEVARIVGCCRSSVDRIIHKNNIKILKNDYSEFYEEMIFLYNNGVSMTDISKKFGCDRGTVSNLLRNRGVDIRGIKRIMHIIEKDLYFDSIADVASFLIENNYVSSQSKRNVSSKIVKCIKNNKKYAGFTILYVDYKF